VRGVSGVLLAGFEFQNRRTGVNLSNCSGCAVVDMVVSGGRLGIRVSHHSDGSLVALSSVSGVQHGTGIFVNTSANVVIDSNTVSTSNGGFRVRTVDPVTITNNSATANRVGFDVRKSPPITTAADLTAAGNTASGNTVADFSVAP
jgi:parallel beta-helix repeat protein